MSEENKKSLVDRYYKWELSVLITSLLLIFWQVFGLNDATSLPLLDVKLRDPSKFPLVTSIILAVEFLFLWIEWKQSEEIARHTFIAKFRFAITVILAIGAVWINLPTLTKGTVLAGVSTLWFVFYFFIGLAIGALTSVLIFVTLTIRSDEEATKFPLSQIPVATRCVYDRSQFSHVAIYLGDGEVADIGPNGGEINSLYDSDEDTHFTLYTFKADVSDESRQDMVKFARDGISKGIGFDYWGIFLMFLRKRFKFPVMRNEPSVADLLFSNSFELVSYF